jgi:hypothetical protein
MSNVCSETTYLFYFFIKKALRSFLLTPSLDAERCSINKNSKQMMRLLLNHRLYVKAHNIINIGIFRRFENGNSSFKRSRYR